MSQLLVIKGPGLGVSYSLGERTRIGRLGENEIQVADPNVSRTHAEIVQDADVFRIYDKGSKNGVLVNGTEISEKKLEPNDEIVIGGSTFLFDGGFNIQNARFSDNSVYVYQNQPADFKKAVTPDDARNGGEGNALVDLAQRIAREPGSLPQLAEVICNVTKDHFQADNVVLFLRDSAVSDLKPVMATPAGAAICLTSELLAKAAGDKQAISLLQTLPVPPGSSSQNSDTKGNAETRQTAVMCAPMVVDSETAGLLVVSRDGNNLYSAGEVALLQALSSLAHISIESVRTLERARHMNRGTVPLDAEQRSASTRSLRMQEIYNSAKRSADGAGTVLITGEPGTGKETLARFIHESGINASGPFVTVNCSAIPPEQFENELFGYEKGAFEGALTAMPGKVEEAQGGTLFLDDIGELDLAVQPRLLRFLQDRAFYRQGGTRAIEANIRVIAATTVDLAAAVRAGKFREDLWYRLNVVPFHMPPLRERREDIGPLLDFFINRHSIALNKKVLGANDSTISLLQKYDWPGNIRELSNCVERAVLLAESKVLSTSDFSHIEEARRRLNSQADLERKRDTKPLAEVERQHIIIALKKHNYNQARAAEALGLHRNTLRNKIIEYGIEISK